MREVLAAKDARAPSLASSEPTNDPAGGSDKEKQARRRGRPAKSDQSEAEFVEWWKPGWRDRFGRTPGTSLSCLGGQNPSNKYTHQPTIYHQVTSDGHPK